MNALVSTERFISGNVIYVPSSAHSLRFFNCQVTATMTVIVRMDWCASNGLGVDLIVKFQAALEEGWPELTTVSNRRSLKSS